MRHRCKRVDARPAIRAARIIADCTRRANSLIVPVATGGTTDIVARAAPDGYTLLFAYAPHTIMPFLSRKVSYDPDRDFAALGQMGASPLVLTVHTALPAANVKELRIASLTCAMVDQPATGAIAVAASTIALLITPRYHRRRT
jgi:tripartite-type tricarboxylate transporter receptor subunit TctC